MGIQNQELEKKCETRSRIFLLLLLFLLSFIATVLSITRVTSFQAPAPPDPALILRQYSILKVYQDEEIIANETSDKVMKTSIQVISLV